MKTISRNPDVSVFHSKNNRFPGHDWLVFPINGRAPYWFKTKSVAVEYAEELAAESFGKVDINPFSISPFEESLIAQGGKK